MREIGILVLIICLPFFAADFVAWSIDVDARGDPMSIYREHQPYDYLQDKSAETNSDRLQYEIELSRSQQDVPGGDEGATL
ncbi:MAG TPA: hypothetical protein VGM05_10505 [Planctomycetaceae bacterium]|jgi:hypothetical protein